MNTLSVRSLLGYIGRIMLVGAVIVLALVAILSMLRPELPRSPGIMSDSLGPDSGEMVSDYASRSAASIQQALAEGDAEQARWALVSASRPLSIAEATQLVDDAPRLSVIVVQVPRAGVAMPVVQLPLAEPTAEERNSEGENARKAALRRGLNRYPATPTGDERQRALHLLTVQRIRAGEAAVIGMVVRAAPYRLQQISARPFARVVEVLPADSVWGRFPIRPLLPQQIVTSEPLLDEAPVPVG